MAQMGSGAGKGGPPGGSNTFGDDTDSDDDDDDEEAGAKAGEEKVSLHSQSIWGSGVERTLIVG